MIPLSKPTKVVEKKGNSAAFEIEALYPGYGVTLGNALRRVLLSSLEGAAVTKVKMKNASHEFTTIEGVQEDVISILLNIKQMRFTIFGNEPQIATLKIKGEKKVKGADFKLPPQLELVNKDIHIATLTSKQAELEMEIQVEKGIGYVPLQARKKEKQEIGSMALDAIFTPARRVSFQVDHMRVGERTDFDRLTLHVETDGTTTPEKALFDASEILLKQFEVIRDGIKDEIKEETPRAGEIEKKPKAKKTKHEKAKTRKKTVKK